MADIHLKARLLQLLAERGPQWDSDLAAAAEAEYPEVRGGYWAGTIRLLLADLYSSGLIRSLEERLGTNGDSKLHFCFELTEFGRERMADTRIVPAGGSPIETPEAS
jgi:hypothetical protein